MPTKLQSQIIHQKKFIQNLPIYVDVENVSLLPVLLWKMQFNMVQYALKIQVT
jgi:hypothetical protein